MLEPLLKPGEVAAYLGISIKTVNDLVRKGSLRCIHVTKKDRRFTHEQLQEFLQRQTDKQPEPVDKKVTGRLPSRRKGGESFGHSGVDLREEMKRWH